MSAPLHHRPSRRGLAAVAVVAGPGSGPGTTQSEPGLSVAEAFFARVADEDFFERSDDPAGVGARPSVGAGHEDHAEMASPARGDGLVVEWAEIAQVVGDNGATF